MTDVFGLEEVSQWNFESWNEPENKHHFDGLHVSVKGYLMYYDACSEGLKMANPSLRLGGPATGYPPSHPIFWVCANTSHVPLLVAKNGFLACQVLINFS